MSTALPALVGVREVMAETGLRRAAAEALMRECRRVDLPVRRWVVYRDDVLRALERRTVAP